MANQFTVFSFYFFTINLISIISIMPVISVACTSVVDYHFGMVAAFLD